jgi:V8-like Glu-specific endopeptidase/endonuclease/exonuclease/phosphatase family metal-dependent hydrolase
MAYPRNLRKIPFIKQVDMAAKPFSEVGDRGGVDNPSRMLSGWTGRDARGLALEPATAKAELSFEADIGRYVTSPASLLQVLADRRRAVAILSVDGRNYDGVEGTWSGTGFIVGRNLFLTNHHVVHSVEAARTAQVEFNYEISPDDLLAGNGQAAAATRKFALDPSRLFLTSPTKDGLDYTFVWIEEAAGEALGTIPMERSSFTVNKNEQAFVVHHPDGKPKQVSLDDTDILGIETRVIHYSSDTMEGSSGAPVFDRRGRLIALHHASLKAELPLPDGGVTKVVNEGIKISAIAVDLENRIRKGTADASYAEAILKEIKGSDTMTGFFGGYGRKVSADRTGPEAVVDTYRGTDQDIDVGFWNIEWLATRWNEPGKLDGAARVIADLNLDAWGLSEVSPPAIKALVDHLGAKYGDRYEYAFSEPDAAAGKQSTAMIWKASSLTGERVAWSSSVEPIFRRRSDDPDLQVEAVHGKIFDRYPGLFRFRTADGLTPYTFFAVPLHLKAMAEGGLRRRLAARILARAIEDLAKKESADVILGGDMNAPLASDDFSAIEDAGFVILGAQDEREGAFSYIKAPKSAIDNIFLSPSMRQTVGKIDYFIVAKDRTMPDYLGISDHRPVAVRLSLAGDLDAERGLKRADLDVLIDEMLVSGVARPKRTARRKDPSSR